MSYIYIWGEGHKLSLAGCFFKLSGYPTPIVLALGIPSGGGKELKVCSLHKKGIIRLSKTRKSVGKAG